MSDREIRERRSEMTTQKELAEMGVHPRRVQPARQPICCTCGNWPHATQRSDWTFACTRCNGYVGYCGPNGCDTGVEHDHWKEGATAPLEAAPDYFNPADYPHVRPFIGGRHG